MSKSLIFLVRFRISDGVNIFAGPKYAQTNLRNILLQGRSRPYFIIEDSTREEPCLDIHVSGRYLVCHAILIIEATSIIFYPPLKNEKGIKIIQKPNRPSRPRRRDRKSDNSNVNSSLKKIIQAPTTGTASVCFDTSSVSDVFQQIWVSLIVILSTFVF